MLTSLQIVPSNPRSFSQLTLFINGWSGVLLEDIRGGGGGGGGGGTPGGGGGTPGGSKVEGEAVAEDG